MQVSYSRLKESAGIAAIRGVAIAKRGKLQAKLQARLQARAPKRRQGRRAMSEPDSLASPAPGRAGIALRAASTG